MAVGCMRHYRAEPRTGHALPTVESAVMRALTPPPRLEAVAQAMPADPALVVADIATGRAELAIFLAARRMCNRVIAIDQSEQAVAIASQLVAATGVDDRVEVRRGDGLAALRPGEAGVIVVAGVGARLMVRMLGTGDGTGKCGLGRLLRADAVAPVLVLQPMSEPHLIRRWAVAEAPRHGYALAGERLVLDAGRYYHIFVLGQRGRAITLVDGTQMAATQPLLNSPSSVPTCVLTEIGPHLLAGPDPLLAGYLIWRSRALTNLAVAARTGGSPRGEAAARSAEILAAALSGVARDLASQSKPLGNERGHGQ